MDPMKRLKVSKEGAIVTNSVNTVTWVEYEQKKGEHAVKPGMEGSWQRQILHRHHCSQFARIYNKKKRKKKKKKEKKIKKNEMIEKKKKKGTGVPVHLQSVPVHLMQKGTVAKVYRYTTNVYRYMRTVFEQIGFLTPIFMPFDILNPSTL